MSVPKKILLIFAICCYSCVLAQGGKESLFLHSYISLLSPDFFPQRSSWQEYLAPTHADTVNSTEWATAYTKVGPEYSQKRISVTHWTAQAKQAVSQLTLQEKVSLATGE